MATADKPLGQFVKSLKIRLRYQQAESEWALLLEVYKSAGHDFDKPNHLIFSSHFRERNREVL